MRLKEIGGSGLVAIEGLPFAAVALVRPETEALLPEAIRRLSRSRDRRGALSVMVPPRPAPEHSDRDDGPVETFAVSGPPAEALLSGRSFPDAPLFTLLSDALGGRIGPIEVVSGDTVPEDVPEGPLAVEAVLPHRGPDRFLEASAASLLRQPGLASLAVGLDQPAPESLGVLAAQENVRLLAFDPAPVGPYVIRQHCALTSRHDVLAMQDSDDVSTAGRLSRQWAHLHETETDILGCHELRIDERHGTVRAHRYPLDANAALAHRLGYVCLMGAMMIRTPTLRRLGGFSTVRRIASDTQFVWRAHFSARIRNLDAFLYVRRVWSGSLTTAPDTGIGVPERARLRQSWSEAFASVRAGRATWRETALGAEEREDEVRVTDVRTGRTQAAILG